jgi:hypothetical protein
MDGGAPGSDVVVVAILLHENGERRSGKVRSTKEKE